MMIDISQWRASIGLWICCQAASRATHSSHHLLSPSTTKDKAVSSKLSGVREIPSAKLPPAALSLITFLLFLPFSMIILMIPNLAGNIQCYQVHTARSVIVTLITWIMPPRVSSFNLFNDDFSLIVYLCMDLLLLSGDIELNPGPTSGNAPSTILRKNFATLVEAITVNLNSVAHHLYAEELIPMETLDYIQTATGISDLLKSGRLMFVLQTQLKVTDNPEQYLLDICHVFCKSQNHILESIAASMIRQLGESDTKPNRSSLIPHDVQEYADVLIRKYKHQPIVAADWPPRIGEHFFGRLALIEKLNSFVQAESAWHLLRGQVDKTVKLTENKEIRVEDVLESTNTLSPLSVVIDGPPGIGKTTLCRKLLNMWSNGTLVHQKYVLVLYCPLRNSRIARATTLADLFVPERYEVPIIAEWFRKRNGKGLLIIFDGWDELSEKLRQSSLAASIICKEMLDECSVIVTSRSYASSSLLQICSKHVQVIGFSENEISTVIMQTLQPDPKLAQELINKDDKNEDTFTITESSKESQLAVKLINDLKVRDDVRSLCYIPLVCSMVILVYRKEKEHLPTTLTQLYENFILQTIRRHVKRHNIEIDPFTLDSLLSLPSELARPFQEICQVAYTNLAKTCMTFSSHQLRPLSETLKVKEDYLGLMTTFIEHDEKKYQFIHLSIQEFLAAWWIAKHEKTEEVFKNCFDDDHFRLCLRFVAGLTHLEHKSYQQYFNLQLDLQCKRRPLFGFTGTYYSSCYQYPEIFSEHITNSSDDSDDVPILVLQLLYESQNTTLCQVLALSINNRSLCLYRLYKTKLSLFDWLCLNYCINNSNITWNHIHLGDISNQELSIFTARLNNSNTLQTQCKRLELEFYRSKCTEKSVSNLLQPSLVYNIHECYCFILEGRYTPYHLLLQFLKLPQLKVLHLHMLGDQSLVYTDKCIELEECVSMNSMLQELYIKYIGRNEVTNTIISVLRGVTKNEAIRSLSLIIQLPYPPSLPNGIIEKLLKDNSTLKIFSLDISDKLMSYSSGIDNLKLSYLQKSLPLLDVNTPLTVLEIEGRVSLFCNSKLSNKLHSLVTFKPYQPNLLFDSYSNLHTLHVQLYRAENATDLFTILRTNTKLKALSLSMTEDIFVYTPNMGTCLQDMLTQNETLKCLEFNNYIPVPFLHFLIIGLQRNTSLQQLSIKTALNKETKNVINVISQSKLTEFAVYFLPDPSLHSSEEDLASLFYEHLLPAVTRMLLSCAVIRILNIQYSHISFDPIASHPNWIELLQHLYEAIFIHPSLTYVEINSEMCVPFLMIDTLKDQKKTLIDKHNKEQHHKPIPVVKLINNRDL